MDFKVAGTRDGITALQLDTKVKGLDIKILQESFLQAKQARLEILKKITDCITSPRKELSPYAPRVTMIKINPDKIREVIGPGGKMINEIIDRAGGKSITEINIEDDGTVYVSSTNATYAEGAINEIKNITREIEAGERFTGKVTRIMDFGAFVEIFPGTEGLVHISELADHRVNKVTDVVKVGDVIPVVVKEIDNMGRINLSYKGALNKSQRPPKES